MQAHGTWIEKVNNHRCQELQLGYLRGQIGLCEQKDEKSGMV